MCKVRQTAQSLAAVGIFSGAAAFDVQSAAAFCSVFHPHPSLPTTVCSFFGRHPFVRYPDHWIGQDLRLTIESADAHGPSMKMDIKDDPDAADHKLDTLRAMFDALRACWVPPASDEARPGMQMSVRFAFKRSGGIIATPRVTYVSPGAPPATREVYLHAITAALERCTPLPLSEGLGRAVAGRPIAIRFVDDRPQP